MCSQVVPICCHAMPCLVLYMRHRAKEVTAAHKPAFLSLEQLAWSQSVTLCRAAACEVLLAWHLDTEAA